jgi:hypothetical protein
MNKNETKKSEVFSKIQESDMFTSSISGALTFEKISKGNCTVYLPPCITEETLLQAESPDLPLDKPILRRQKGFYWTIENPVIPLDKPILRRQKGFYWTIENPVIPLYVRQREDVKKEQCILSKI